MANTSRNAALASDRVNIRDVARLAGVSYQTVSRVLNDHPSVRPATRERVRAVIDELDYRPSRAARSLSTRRSGVIGVLATSSTGYGQRSCIRAIEEAAHARGFLVAVADPGGTDPAEVGAALDYLFSQQVEALAVVSPHDEAVTALDDLPGGIPRVVLQAPGRGTDAGLSVDQFGGARQAVRHLLELGHTAIAHVTGPAQWLEAAARVAGVQAELAAHGLASLRTIEGDWSPRAGYRAGLELAGLPGLTAVVSANDQMALGLLHAFHEVGVTVPQRVSVVGFDDIPEAEHFWPPLTTIRQDFDELGRRCVARLLGTAQDVRAGPIPAELIVRASTASPTPG